MGIGCGFAVTAGVSPGVFVGSGTIGVAVGGHSGTNGVLRAVAALCDASQLPVGVAVGGAGAGVGRGDVLLHSQSTPSKTHVQPVGRGVGLNRVGVAVGIAVGLTRVGIRVGLTLVGTAVGLTRVGIRVGLTLVGTAVGLTRVGIRVGLTLVGTAVGLTRVGIRVGLTRVGGGGVGRARVGATVGGFGVAVGRRVSGVAVGSG